MHSEIEVQRKDYGFVVCVISESEEDHYAMEEYALEDPLDVLAEVLRWLGYDEDTRDAVTEMLDEDVAYELTDKGHETLAELEREQAGRSWDAAYKPTDRERERADRDWEIQRLEAELAALKRGSGRTSDWGNTTRQYETTTTGR